MLGFAALTPTYLEHAARMRFGGGIKVVGENHAEAPLRRVLAGGAMHAASGSMGNSAGCPIIRDSALESLMLEKVVDL